MSVQAVLFDMDGVIFEGRNFWLDLHGKYGTTEEGIALAERYLATDYASLAKEVGGRLWKGRPAGPYWELVSSREFQPGIREVFSYIHASGLRSAIVSSGPTHLAERAQRELGIDAIRANRLLFDGGYLSGEVEVQVRDSEKVRSARAVLDEFGVDFESTAFVGDSDPDVELAGLVGVSVAYDSTSERLVKACTHTLEHGNLSRLVEILGSECVKD